METENIISLIAKIHERADRLLFEELGKTHAEGLVSSHGDILMKLFQNEKLSMKDLSDKIGRKKNTVTVLSDKLLTLGYINRKPDAKDKRIAYLSLTEKGMELRSKVQTVINQLLDRAQRGFNDREKELFLEFLLKTSRNFD